MHKRDKWHENCVSCSLPIDTEMQEVIIQVKTKYETYLFSRVEHSRKHMVGLDIHDNMKVYIPYADIQNTQAVAMDTVGTVCLN